MDVKETKVHNLQNFDCGIKLGIISIEFSLFFQAEKIHAYFVYICKLVLILPLFSLSRGKLSKFVLNL